MQQILNVFKSKTVYLYLFLIISLNAFSQTPQNKTSDPNNRSSNKTNNESGGNIGIGTNSPHASAVVEVASVSQGFLPPRMTVVQRDSISSPAEGLMIFNTSSGCPNYYFNGSWREWCGFGVMPLATLSGLDCGSTNTTGSLFMGISASEVSSTIPYTGGNGGVYSMQAVSSTGVNGLTANLSADTLESGSGTLVYTITGTPDNSGTATFLISLGGQSCSFSINVGLPAPFITTSSPESPTRFSTTPTLFISGPANKTIQVFNNASGTGSPIATAVASTNIGGVYYASVSVTVSTNSSTTFTAKAVDGIGNVSALSNSFNYIHDIVAPSAPSFSASTPSSPSNTSTTPILNLLSEAGSLIRIYVGSSCTGTPIATGTASGIGIASISVIANSNSATVFTAAAIDAAGNLSACSTPFTYIHDAVAPSKPVFTGSTPASPSNTSTSPNLNLTAEPGSIIRIYSGNSCSGSIIASGVVSAGGVASITVTAASNTTSLFTATATDAAGNVSVCSTPISYTHDNVAPTTPIINSSSPSSPGTSLTPILNVIGEIGTTLRIYNNAGGTGSPVSTVTIPAGGIATVNVSVLSGSTTTFTARLTDAAGNVSGLSLGFTYVHTP